MSAEPSKRCDLLIYLPERQRPIQIPATLRNDATPRRRKGKAHPHHPATSSGRSEKPTAKRRRCAWPATNLEPRPPAARTKAKRLPREATDAGAKCRREPGRARRNAISRRHPPFQWHQERAGNAPNSGTEPPSHAARLRGKEREKENRQLRRGLVGGTTATLQYGDTDGAGVDETRGNGGRRRYGGVEERTEEGEWGRRRFNGGANN